LAVNPCVWPPATVAEVGVTLAAAGIVTVACALLPAAAVAVTVAVCWLAVAAGAVYVVVVPLAGDTDPSVAVHVTGSLAVNPCVRPPVTVAVVGEIVAGSAGTVTTAAAALPEDAVAVTVAVCALPVAAGAVYVVVVPLVADIDPTPDRLHVTAWLAVNACVCRACTETLPDGVIVTCTGTVTTAAAALPEDAVAVTVAVCALPVAAGAVYVVVVPLAGDTDPSVAVHVTGSSAVNTCVWLPATVAVAGVTVANPCTPHGP
jgi:hypothetical protein